MTGSDLTSNRMPMANFRRGVGFCLRRHLVACAACAARLAETLSLRDRIRAEIPRFAAPESLRARVMALAGAPRRAPRRAAAARSIGGDGSAAGALAGCCPYGVRPVCRQRDTRSPFERGPRLGRRDRACPGDARQPVDSGRLVRPAHRETVAVGAPRLFAAGPGSCGRRLSARRRTNRISRWPSCRHARLPLSRAHRRRLRTAERRRIPACSSRERSAVSMSCAPKDRGMDWLAVSDAAPTRSRRCCAADATASPRR